MHPKLKQLQTALRKDPRKSALLAMLCLGLLIACWRMRGRQECEERHGRAVADWQ